MSMLMGNLSSNMLLIDLGNGLHRSHFGSRYKLGCCVFAGLFWDRAWFKSNPFPAKRYA